MIKKNLKTLMITSVVILLPMVAGLMLWDRLPAQLPIHWNAAGQVDGWASKVFVVFGLPSILLAFQWVCALATSADPKQRNHSEKLLKLVLWIVPLLSTVLQTICYTVALGQTVPMEVVMPVFMGLLFAIIGNYLPKCKQNYTIGIKLPWTLDSEENWNLTHRLAGRLWVACGLAITLTGFLGSFWPLMILTLPMVLIPVLYSYVLHRKGI